MHAALPTEVIFIGGRSGAGKSSVAAEASHLLARADIRHAVIEGDSLDQAYPQPWRNGIDLAEQNLAAIWRNYRLAGYSRLIFTNTVSVLEIPSLTAALGTAALGEQVHSFGVLLTASDSATADRFARREIGTALEEHIERSMLTAARLNASSTAYRVATDDRTITDIATEILHAAGWLRGVSTDANHL